MNVQYKSHMPLEQWANERGHNWLIHQALKWLRQYASDFLPETLDETLIQFGVAFADSPWFGQPESFDSRHLQGRSVISIREDLAGVKASEDCTGWGNESCVLARYVSNPNLYLSLRWMLHSPVYEDVEMVFAADNLAHYPHNGPVRLDGTSGRTDVVASGSNHRWGVNAMYYGATLYELARSFWDGLDPEPDLYKLRSLSTGTIQIPLWTTTSHARTKVPSTHLGGNPFIRTQEGWATWPIWVLSPDNYSPEKLKNQHPGRSARAAAIYLGWSLHMMHDLAVPFHAMNQAGKIHAQTENELDVWIKEGKFDHLPVVKTSSPGGKIAYKWIDEAPFWPNFSEEFKRQDFCRSYSSTPAYGSQYQIEEGQLLKRFEDMVSKSRSFFKATHPSKRSREEESIGAWEYLLDCALKHTIMMIACLKRQTGFVGTVKDKSGKRLNHTELIFRSKDRAVEKKVYTDSNGEFAIALPTLTDYEIHVNAQGMPHQENKWYRLTRGGFTEVNIILGGSTIPNSIEGIVYLYVGTTSRRPLKNVQILVLDSQGVLVQTTTTGNNGRYNLQVEKPGSHTVKAKYSRMIKECQINVIGKMKMDWGFSIEHPIEFEDPNHDTGRAIPK